MVQKRRESCPHCGSLDVIKWGCQNAHQRYRCKGCGSHFTFRRKDVEAANRFVWFRWWVKGKQTIEDISRVSGHSVRQLKRWFQEYLERAPTWTIRRSGSVHLLIDGTWFKNELCLVVYRDNNVKSTLFYRLTDDEKEEEIKDDILALKSLGIRIASVTTDGGLEIVRALKQACPEAIRQRCLAHVERECLTWITQHPRTSAGKSLRRLALQIAHIETHNDELYWKRCLKQWHEEYGSFIEQKTVSQTTGETTYTHEGVRRAYHHIRRALPDMFRFIDDPEIPKTTNALESFFGHLKDNLRVHRGLSFEHYRNFIKLKLKSVRTQASELGAIYCRKFVTKMNREERTIDVTRVE